MPVESNAAIEITAFDWVPDFARGFVRDLRPRWACEELGLPYRERLISAMNRPDWFYGEQPFGQVPVVKDGDLHLFESGAILIHLAEREGRLLPASGQARADVLGWLFAAYNSIEPLAMEQASVLIFHAGEDWAEARKPILFETIEKKLARLADAQGDREWIAGDFSIADIALLSVLREFERSEAFAKFPALVAYLARGTARPAFTRAIEAQLAAFNDQPSQAA
jgi:glutathione S-transferase